MKPFAFLRRVSAIKYPHDQLILINADEDAPQNLMDNTAPSGSGDFQVGDRVAAEWIRLQEPDEDSPEAYQSIRPYDP
jgi:hypothetical protein